MSHNPSAEELRAQMQRDHAYVVWVDKLLERGTTGLVIACLIVSLAFFIGECRKAGLLP